MTDSAGLSRRQFATGAAAAAGIMIVPRHVLGKGKKAPSDTLNIVSVGAGGRARSDINGCAHENIVALCDVDWNRAHSTFAQYPNAKPYKDFRVMLKKEKGIDAVIIGTPDHTHAVIAMEAISRGLHVYCEKPLTRTIHEARVLGKAAKQADVVTQMGNQGHAMEGTRQIREWIEAGVIGDVSRIEYWTNRPIWPQAIDRPTEAHHVPPWLDWDLFLGPAKFRPYHPAYHPFAWRGWWDYGTGALGDIACHAMDAAFWIFDLRDPDRVSAETTKLYAETAPAASRIHYHFPKRGDRPELDVVWRDGNLQPPRPPELADDEQLPQSSGQFYVGSKGVLAAGIYGENPTLYPSKLHAEVIADPPPTRYPRTDGAHKEWTQACKGEGKAGSDFTSHSGPLTELGLLGNLAVRSGRALEWDAAQGRVTNHEAANQYLHDEYRKGWSLG
ncbi:MAG: Gfo/Idh/MocA family oxidoreductase [Acidobacteriota bacterium]|nr:Gfo/Idh/MocA family oxidoreductase [Acidobacteriota bacterium]